MKTTVTVEMKIVRILRRGVLLIFVCILLSFPQWYGFAQSESHLPTTEQPSVPPALHAEYGKELVKMDADTALPLLILVFILLFGAGGVRAWRDAREKNKTHS